MLIGPLLPPERMGCPGDTRGKIGGAAGNRTRVQSAYYARVYLHSRLPRRLRYRRSGLRIPELSVPDPRGIRSRSADGAPDFVNRLAADLAARAVVKTPKTAEPLPDIAAIAAPAFRSRSLSAPIAG